MDRQRHRWQRFQKFISPFLYGRLGGHETETGGGRGMGGGGGERRRERRA